MQLPPELQPTASKEVFLPSGRLVKLPLCNVVFQTWNGTSVGFDYGKKPILNYKNVPCFAELVILQLLLEQGWDGAWIETYGGTHFIRSMPKSWSLKSEHVLIPNDKEELLRKIWEIGKTKACFDVMVWKDNQVLFFEGKNIDKEKKKKDKFTLSQLKFIEGALASGFTQESLIVVEWKTR
jgi:hypothetical protein